MNKKDPEKIKIRREIIFAALIFFLVVFSTYEELRMISFSNVSVTSKIIVYAYINITIVLFLLMSFLVLRNVVKLIIERKRGVIGAKLRTKLVGLFVIVSVVPSVFMFIVMIATGFASNIINKWYSLRFEKAMYYTSSIIRHKSGLIKSAGDAAVNRKIEWLEHFYKEYSQIRFIKNPMETTYLIFFSIFTLIVLFISSWVGFYLSKKLTKPIIDLVEGTKKVASGDLDINVNKESDDEIGMLVNSFNAMALDLKNNKEEIEKANADLKKVNEEIDRRRRFMEIILKNIHAGVIAVDSTGKIRSLNNAAEYMFGIGSKDAAGRNYKDVFDKSVFSDIRSIIRDLTKTGKETLTKEIKLNIGGSLKVYIVNLTVLKDEADNYIGFIIVLNDTTDMMKAQRVAAWEEVAKRMSHEIKNPLTPIRLSAERLKRKYGSKINSGDDIFNDSIDTIIKEVDDLKNLVDEFSLYARLPKANFELTDLNSLIGEVVMLYKNAHKNIEFVEKLGANPSSAFVDKRQMKRAFMNIIDNAVFSITLKSIEKVGGIAAGAGFNYKAEIRITTETAKDETAKGDIIRMIFSDNGTGINDEVMQNMYEPYFSTKQGGTGLGLAITKNIMMENNAAISAKNNEKGGADFIIELPADKI
ncbi:MAG: ATP-binding protein [Deltaproteobacteria bacterium]|nr:ATP-binding protein [Deltaproteobacteria bacterium]